MGKKNESNHSLERDQIKLKGNGKKIIIPLDPKEENPWKKSWEEEQEALKLYQVIQGYQDNVEDKSQ
jgi:hypothetical protein